MIAKRSEEVVKFSEKLGDEGNRDAIIKILEFTRYRNHLSSIIRRCEGLFCTKEAGRQPTKV